MRVEVALHAWRPFILVLQCAGCPSENHELRGNVKSVIDMWTRERKCILSYFSIVPCTLSRPFTFSEFSLEYCTHFSHFLRMRGSGNGGEKCPENSEYAWWKMWITVKKYPKVFCINRVLIQTLRCNHISLTSPRKFSHFFTCVVSTGNRTQKWYSIWASCPDARFFKLFYRILHNIFHLSVGCHLTLLTR